jgi:hypothetical protein
MVGKAPTLFIGNSLCFVHNWVVHPFLRKVGEVEIIK